MISPMLERILTENSKKNTKILSCASKVGGAILFPIPFFLFWSTDISVEVSQRTGSVKAASHRCRGVGLDSAGPL